MEAGLSRSASPCPAILSSRPQTYQVFEREAQLSPADEKRWRTRKLARSRQWGDPKMIRVDPNEPMPAVLTSSEMFAHSTEPRRFTIDEARIVCSFPADFILKGTYGEQWARLGNAVAPAHDAGDCLGAARRPLQPARPRPVGIHRGPMSELELCPMTLGEARAYVDEHHRHHLAPAGGLFAIGATRGAAVVGVAIVGRPVARELADDYTAEVTRLCTDGSRNACSLLYGAAWRACRAMGYRRLVTYTLASESGGSLRAAGWKQVGSVRAESWSRPSRPRVDRHPLQGKLRWEVGGSVQAAAAADGSLTRTRTSLPTTANVGKTEA